MFEATTRDIRVEVKPAYVMEESNPAESLYFFSYHVRIHNQGRRRVQLLSRHWIITDSFGKTEEVAGPGVIGEQPVLQPGDSYEYSSFCPLTTPTGSMRGTYTMVDDSGHMLQVEIPDFLLAEPGHFH